MEYSDIENSVEGLDNMGGTQPEMLYCSTSDILEFPELPSASTATLDTAAVIAATGIVLKAGKKMNKLYSTPDMAECKWEEQGPVDGKSVMGKLSISHPGIKAKIAGFIRASNNGSMFFIVPNNDGEYYALGTPKLPAKRDGAMSTTGKATGDGKVTELTFKAPSRCPVIVTMTDAELARLTTPAVATP